MGAPLCMPSATWCNDCVLRAVRYRAIPRKTVINPKIPAAANNPGRITWQSGLGFVHWLRWLDSTAMPIIRSTSAMVKQILQAKHKWSKFFCYVCPCHHICVQALMDDRSHGVFSDDSCSLIFDAHEDILTRSQEKENRPAMQES